MSSQTFGLSLHRQCMHLLVNLLPSLRNSSRVIICVVIDISTEHRFREDAWDNEIVGDLGYLVASVRNACRIRRYHLLT